KRVAFVARQKCVAIKYHVKSYQKWGRGSGPSTSATPIFWPQFLPRNVHYSFKNGGCFAAAVRRGAACRESRSWLSKCNSDTRKRATGQMLFVTRPHTLQEACRVR